MAEYKSPVQEIKAPAERVWAKLSNPGKLQEWIDNIPAESIPEDKRKALEGLQLTDDSITIPGGPAGQVTLRVAERREPTLLEFRGEGTPVPLSVALHLEPLGTVCNAQVVINIEIPAMFKPMVSGPLQKMANEFAMRLGQIPY